MVLSWSREDVPPELASLHVDRRTWASVWGNVRRTYARTSRLEAEKNDDILAIDIEWGKLLEMAKDSFYMYSINVSLATRDRAAKTKYCGIILRFRPIVSTIPVISEATISPAQTFAQDGGATIAMPMPIPSAPEQEETTEDITVM